MLDAALLIRTYPTAGKYNVISSVMGQFLNRMKICIAVKICSAEPGGQLKSLRRIAPDPGRWSGCQARRLTLAELAGQAAETVRYESARVAEGAHQGALTHTLVSPNGY
jgi:hypothetical protein